MQVPTRGTCDNGLNFRQTSSNVTYRFSQNNYRQINEKIHRLRHCSVSVTPSYVAKLRSISRRSTAIWTDFTDDYRLFTTSSMLNGFSFQFFFSIFVPISFLFSYFNSTSHHFHCWTVYIFALILLVLHFSPIWLIFSFYVSGFCQFSSTNIVSYRRLARRPAT